MNYLKNISNIKSLSRLESEEAAYLKTRSETAKMIGDIAWMMFEKETNREIYILWAVIASITEAIYIRKD